MRKINEDMKQEALSDIIRIAGTRLPKKHGDWYRLPVYDNHYLVLDTWNGHIYHYPDGAEPTDTNNMYRCVYSFFDSKGRPYNYERVSGHMIKFWYAHISHLKHQTP
jgi:hypothetical protein